MTMPTPTDIRAALRDAASTAERIAARNLAAAYHPHRSEP